MRNIEEIKKTILDFLEKNGPCLPISIAREINMDLVFASAIISELTLAHKVRSSSLKVGSSQIFYLEGQEEKLEPFAEKYLSGVVKKAFLDLREKKFLIDKDQEPAVRVALRSLKDFASPFKYKDEVMWRYNFVSKEKLSELLEGKTRNKEEVNSKEVVSFSDKKENDEKELKEKSNDLDKGSVKEDQQIARGDDLKKETVDLIEEKKSDKNESVDEAQTKLNEVNEEKKSFESPFEKRKKQEEDLKREKNIVYEGFSKEVVDYLNKKDVELVEEIDSSRNEFVAKVRINSDLGKINFLLIARNKKSVSEQDIIVAYQKSSEQKMPCFLIHKGKLSKKSIETLEQYSNLVKVDKI